MTAIAACPKCGSPLPADAPGGLCPKCLVQAGFEGGLGSQSERDVTTAPTKSTGFEPPSVDELGKRFPQLEILKLLGHGGMGAVYQARQPGLDRLVALKVLPPEVGRNPAFVERFQREAQALAKLNHPHIVAVYDFGQTGDLCYFVMEYVDGVNLRQTIAAGGLSTKDALAIVPQICEALQFAHDEGIVHRDIKPENILIDKRGRVKIADFGLAKLLGQDASDHPLTATHQVMGTLRYMAPEQMQGSREVDHRADIFSLGVVFYELLTGELPLGKFAPPSKKVQIDVRLDEVVLRALEQDPEQRYQHASDVKTDMDIITQRHKSVTTHAASGSDEDQQADRDEGESIPFHIEMTLGIFALLAANVVTELAKKWDAKGLVTGFSLGAVFLIVLAVTYKGSQWIYLRIAPARRTRRQASEKTGAGSASPRRVGRLASTPLTQVRFNVSDSQDVARQAIFHFSAIGYQLIEQQPDVCVFQRGGKWAGLWATDIRNIHTILTVRTTPAAGSLLWVSCDWSVRSLGAWVTRRDIGQLETEGYGLETLLGGHSPSESRNRIGRTEWVGGETRAAAGKSMVGAIEPSDRTLPEFRQQDAKEILSLLMSGLYCMSIAGWGMAIYGGARVIADGSVAESFSSDVLAFGWCLAGSIVAQVALRKGWAQGRDRLARLGALNLVAVGGLLSFVSSRWCGLPSWVGLSYSLVAFVGYLMLRGKDVSSALRTRANQSPSPRKELIEPRFSRFAIAGAVWGLFGLLAVIPTLFFIALNRVWNGTALPTDLVHEQPPLAFTAVMGVLLAIGAGAPIGTTIYGAIAIRHIKRSGGKIIGLPLAMIDALFFPLLAICVGIALPISLALHALLSLQLIAVAVPSAMFALIICFGIGLALWRKVAPVPPGSEINLREKLRLAGIGLLIAGIADAATGCVWIGNNINGLWNLWQSGAPLSGQVVQTLLSLCSIVLVYYVVGVALWLLKLEEECDPSITLLCAAIAPPGCLIGLPAAIYAFVQLSKPEAKALFSGRRSASDAT